MQPAFQRSLYKTTAIILLSTLSSGLTVGLNMATTAVAAEPSDKNVLQIEEITVIARQRSESLQQVPVAVTAFTETDLQNAGIETPADFINMTSNVSIVETDSAGVSFITIRGLSQVRNGESPVAIVVDGVLQTEARQFNQELFDVKQIEVLKGPQGALYGRNAIGGAIVIKTKEPGNDFNGKIMLGAGDDGLIKAQASVSGPLIKDKLFARISGSHKSHNGHLQNVFLNQAADYYQDQSGRVRLIFKPTENFRADFRIGYGETSGGALYFVRNNRDINGNYNFGLTSPNTSHPDDIGPPIESNNRGEGLRKIFTASLKLDWDFDLGTLTSVSAYDWVNEWTKADNSPYTRTLGTTQAAERDIKSKSQELRFTSNGEQRFRYIFGAYYLRTDRYINRNTGQDLGQGILLGINGPTSQNPTLTAFQDENDQKAYAFFGQFNFDITDQLELSAAIRYDKDKRKQTDVAPPAFSTTSGLSRERTFDSFQPKVTLRYSINDSSSVYASYAKGFRSGGFNQNGVRARALLTDPNTLVQDDYKQEDSTGYEIGWKSQFFDRMVTINGAFFYTEFENEQFFSFIPSAAAQIVTNIDKVDLKGFEIELHARPMQGLEIFGGIGYTNSKIKAYSASPATVGNKAPYVPKLGLNAGIQYTQPLTDSLQSRFRVDWQQMGRQYWDVANNGARSTVDLTEIRIGLGDTDGVWEVAGWMKNVFDKRYNAEFVAGGFAFPAEPRTYGVDVTYSF